VISRRRFLAEVCGGLAAAPVLGAWGMRAAGAPPHSPPPSVNLAGALRDRAAAKGLFYGAATTRGVLQRDAAFAARFGAECGLLVPESELKWNRVHPEPGRYDFSGADWLADFARDHGMRFRGHALVYFQNEPAWVVRGSTPDGPADALRAHIREVAGRYAGRMHSWDVVNEILELNDRRRDGLRRTPLLDRLGPDFVPLSFHAAAEADPNALLVWNENQLEYDVAYQAARRDAVLRLLQAWRAAGVPVQALGIQSHLRQHATAFDPKRYRDFLGQVAALGLKIVISELDVFDADLPKDPAVRDQAVAGAYAEYLAAALDEPAVLGVITWGLSDRHTWLSSFHPRGDGAEARPLPLDADLQPTAAWHAIARAFDGAPARKANG
jgi:endo-1,4-beta-xylanase